MLKDMKDGGGGVGRREWIGGKVRKMNPLEKLIMDEEKSE